MAKFLRDRHIRNLTISKARIAELFAACETYEADLAARGIPPAEITLGCTVRFDEKGYTVYSLSEIHEYYDQANQVERLIFSVETQLSQSTNRRQGSFLELTLDRHYHLCFLTVASDDRVWVDATFSSLSEIIKKSQAWYGFVRTVWTELLIQIAGIAFVFLISIRVAVALSPNLRVQNSHLLAFLFAFLLGANIWGALQRQVHVVIQRAFPNVQFIRAGKENLHWLVQGLILTVVGIIITAVSSKISSLFMGLTQPVFGY